MLQARGGGGKVELLDVDEVRGGTLLHVGNSGGALKFKAELC